MNQKLRSRQFCIMVTGNLALFTKPEFRLGGEKLTYFVPTYESLKGIIKNIYWKPTFIIIIDAVRVLNKWDVVARNKRLQPVDSPACDRAIYTMLHDVAYQILWHYEWNLNNPQFTKDRDFVKHNDIFCRRVNEGAIRRLYFGVSECLVESYDFSLFGDGKGHYDDSGEIDLGVMFHSFTYPDEWVRPCDEGFMTKNFFHPVMKDGVIWFPRPEECEMYTHVRRQKAKVFPNKYEIESEVNDVS